jgi:hypothetical protein
MLNNCRFIQVMQSLNGLNITMQVEYILQSRVY